jgi:hypothetical protein
MQLSSNAQKLYEFLLQTGGAWENKCIEALYPKPPYVGTLDPNYSDDQKKNIQEAYWQWEVNCNGMTIGRPVLGINVEFISNADYSKDISAAYQELRKSGLADEKNSGFNDYYFYPIKK